MHIQYHPLQNFEDTRSSFEELPSAGATMSDMSKEAHQDLEATAPSEDHDERSKSLSYDAQGDTVITKEDGEVFVIDEKAERALVWKFDLRILPLLALMYLFNALDKSNLGNAKTAGLEKTLKLTGNQYNIILSVFFVPYVLTAPFLGILGKMYGPSRVLPCMMFTFGCCTVLTVATFNFSGLLALRWFLGMAESVRISKGRKLYWAYISRC